MKKIYILFLAYAPIALSTMPPFSAPSSEMGKTHFIVGVDSNKVEKKLHVSDPVCHYDPITSLLICSDGTVKQALFSPDDDIAGMLTNLIANEQEAIKAAIFSFTDGGIAQALLDAKKRGVLIEIITDASCVRDKFNKIEMLQAAGIKVLIYTATSKQLINDIMHNKFVLFEKNIRNRSLLWTGSFNFTKSAKLKNQENVLILDEISLYKKYDQQFARIKKRIINPDDPSVKVARLTKQKKLKNRKKDIRNSVIIA